MLLYILSMIRIYLLICVFASISLFVGISLAIFDIHDASYNLSSINQDSDESGITFLDGWLVYSSSYRFNGTGGWDLWAVSINNVFPKNDIYFYGLNSKGLIISDKNVSLLISVIDTDYNEASPSYCPLSKKLYFHSNRPKGEGLEDIYEASIIVSDKKGVIVKSVENIGGPINTPFIEACPFISEDGKLIIFSSDRTGGYGGLDLWFSMKNIDGWSEPINMGPLINTQGNEKFPYLTDIGLFWASDGREDSKSFDIYFTTDYLGGNSPVIRLPSPINSQFNDWGLTLYKDKYIVWSSDRPFGAGGIDFLYIEIPELRPDIMDIIMSLLD